MRLRFGIYYPPSGERLGVRPLQPSVSGKFSLTDQATALLAPDRIDTSDSVLVLQVMRLWSLHPSLLDRAGLVALWREALLAQQVLLGNTKGYRHHPQLDRFQACKKPLAAIATYLWSVAAEAKKRGYSFDTTKIALRPGRIRIPVTSGQLEYELTHLKKKTSRRDRALFTRLKALQAVSAHPLFKVVDGEVEPWERT
jgi:hypothetical protein